MATPHDLQTYSYDLAQELLQLVLKRTKEDGFDHDRYFIPIATLTSAQLVVWTGLAAPTLETARSVKRESISIINSNLP